MTDEKTSEMDTETPQTAQDQQVRNTVSLTLTLLTHTHTKQKFCSFPIYETHKALLRHCTHLYTQNKIKL